MPNYLPDTNVLIDFGHNPQFRTKLEGLAAQGEEFVIAPPALIELVRGMVRAGDRFFENDQQVFQWLHARAFAVLELPRVFMAGVLRTTWKASRVVPRHYSELIAMIALARNFADFLEKSREGGSVWTQIGEADDIHNAELDKEFRSMEQLAKKGVKNLAALLARTFGVPGCRPNPIIVARRFSAALEFLEKSLFVVQAGSKPRKNDPGLYVDFQLLVYLADPETRFVTQEDFSQKIRRSEQRDRIIHPNVLA